MDGYAYLIAEKIKYQKDIKDLLLAGLVSLLIGYFILSRPSFPSRHEYTWSMLISFYLVSFYVGFSFVAGWKLMTGFTSRAFLFLPIIGWVIYFFIKVALSLMVGGAYFYSLFRLGQNLYKINRVNKQIDRLRF